MFAFRRALFAAALAVLPIAASAQSGGVTVENPFARPSAGMSGAGAAYMTVRGGAVADKLVSASVASAGFVSKVELHDHIRDGDVMRMRKIDAVEIPAGGAAELKPGGKHVMLIGLRAPLKTGESFDLTLTFEKAGAVTVKVPVLEMGAGMQHGQPKQHGPKH